MFYINIEPLKNRIEDVSLLVEYFSEKISKNYNLTFDKKNLRGLVSIPKYVAFKNGLEFANENVKWLYEEINKILPLVLIQNFLFQIKVSLFLLEKQIVFLEMKEVFSLEQF